MNILRNVLFCLLLALGLCMLSSQLFAQVVFLDAVELIDSKSKYLILDVRGQNSRKKIHGAVSVNLNFLDFTNEANGVRSLLKSTDEIKKHFHSLGVDGSKPVLIVGKSIRGFGEEGRLFWILHGVLGWEAKILNGGDRAWFANHKTLKQHILAPGIQEENRSELESKSKQPGKAQLNQLDSGHLMQLSKENFFEEISRFDQILDVRSIPEYFGMTPFGERWGGRIPGSKNLPWTRFFDENGFLTTVPKELKNAQSTLVYCTAGYRSALVYAVLLHHGLKTSNYDGSWYEVSQLFERNEEDFLQREGEAD